MTPKIARRGTSFKGAGLYYLHDKREPGEDYRSTDERVAWTKTRNIASDNAEFAFRIMAATAMDKDRLKEQAGVKNTGRKSKGEVYSYSLGWHPEEKDKLTKKDMMQAVDQSLKALGAQDHQAVIIAHQDTDHPHVHVVLNLVHPDTGKNMNLSNDRNKLDKWANDYRRARGEDHKYNPNRAKKYDAIEDKKRGMVVDFIPGENIPRGLLDDIEQIKKSLSKNDYRRFKQHIKRQFENEKIKVSIDGKSKNLNLSQFGVYQRNKHQQQWQDLKTQNRNKKKQINQDYLKEKERTTQAIKTQMKPAFAQIYTQHQQKVAYWNKRDKHLVGKLQNAIEAVKYTKQLGRGENPHFVKSLFNALSKIGYREQALKNVLDKQVKELKSVQKKQIKDAVSLINQNRKERLDGEKQYLDLKTKLIKDTQEAEEKDLKARWKRLNDRRKKAVEALIHKIKITPKGDAKSRAENIAARKEFKQRSKRRRSRPRGKGSDKER